MIANHPKSSAVIPQGNHMNAAELISVRGVSAVPVAFRAAVLLSPLKREFIWYLQGLSLNDGGFKRLARELLQMFPDRIGTPDMDKARLVPEKMYPADLVSLVQGDLNPRARYYNEASEPKKGSKLIQLLPRKSPKLPLSE